MKIQMELNIKKVLFCLKLVLLNGLFNIFVTAHEINEQSSSTYYKSSEERSLCDSINYNKTCCNEGEFQCGNGNCIPQEKVCESLSSTVGLPTSFDTRMRLFKKTSDCSDGTDEIGCVDLPCNSRTGKNCPHNCIDLPGNISRCTCYQGYTLQVRLSKDICEDIDECKMGVHLCSQACINHEGGFKCGCRDGFKINNITGSCKADDRNIQILYNSKNVIYSYNLATRTKIKLVYGDSLKDITYDPVTEIMYWNDNDNVYRSYIPGAKGGNVTVGLRQFVNITTFNGNILKNSLSIDWISGNLYWLSTDTVNKSKTLAILSKVDGRYVRIVREIPNGLSLAVDPELGMMYYSSGGNESHIGKCWLNGMLKLDIIRLPNQNPISLTLDHLSRGRLYWFDSISNTLFYVNNDGTRATKIKKIETKFTFLSIDIFENYIYWVNNVSGSLMRIDKFGRGDVESLVTNLDNPSFIKIYHPRRLNVGRRRSFHCSNQCSHLCLNMPRGYDCWCPLGSKLIFKLSERFCDREIEDAREGPLACNCNDKELVCNESSIYWNCPCFNECPHKINDLDYNKYFDKELNNTLYISSTLIIIAIIIIISIIIFFGLSFWKK